MAKLSQADHENIGTMEALDITEDALLTLLCRYFVYRQKSSTGEFEYPPSQALHATIRWAIELGIIGSSHEKEEAK